MSPAWPASRPPPCPACCAAPSSCARTPASACSASSPSSGFVPDASARGLTRGRKDIIALAGLVRGADEMDIERSSLLFIDHIVHAAETCAARDRLLPAADLRQPRRAVREAGSRHRRQGRRPAHRRGGPGPRGPARPGRPAARRRHRRPAATRPSADVYLGDNISGMTALAGHLTGQHRYHRLCFVAGPEGRAGRRRTVARPSSRPSRAARAAPSTRSSTGTSRRTAASRPPGSCSAAPPCRRPWSARTTRWPSACCASCSGRASGSRRTWR